MANNEDSFGKGNRMGTARRKLGYVIGRQGLEGRVDPGLAEGGVWDGKDIPGVPMKMAADGVMVPKIRSNASNVPVELETEALRLQATGMSPAEIEYKLGVGQMYLQRAMSRRYGSRDAAKRVIADLMLRNTIIMGEHAALNVEEMTPAQAILGAKVAAETALIVEKSLQDAPKTISFGDLADVGATLADISAMLRGESAMFAGGDTPVSTATVLAVVTVEEEVGRY